MAGGHDGSNVPVSLLPSRCRSDGGEVVVVLLHVVHSGVPPELSA